MVHFFEQRGYDCHLCHQQILRIQPTALCQFLILVYSIEIFMLKLFVLANNLSHDCVINSRNRKRTWR
jgi:hypothetical protein